MDICALEVGEQAEVSYIQSMMISCGLGVGQARNIPKITLSCFYVPAQNYVGTVTLEPHRIPLCVIIWSRTRSTTY
jgi:hypothetical protein